MCDYGEDIFIERGILNWYEKYDIVENGNLLDNFIEWSDESLMKFGSELNILLFVLLKMLIFYGKEVCMD